MASKAGVFPEAWSLDHVGPITKTVEDCAILMDTIAGYDRSDPSSIKFRTPQFTLSIKEAIDGIRVGIAENYFFDLVEAEVKKLVMDGPQTIILDET